MKHIFLVAMVAIAMSCNSSKNGDTKADSSGAPTSTESSSGDNEDSNGAITFKANGETVNTGVVNLAGFKFPAGAIGVNITSDMTSEKRTVNFNLNGYAAGDYTFTTETVNKPGTAIGMYFPDYSQGSDSYSFISGKVNVSRFDTVNHVFEATFSGTTKNSEGKTIEITDGVVKNGKLSPMQEMPK